MTNDKDEWADAAVFADGPTSGVAPARRFLFIHVLALLVFLGLWTWKLLEPNPVPEAVSEHLTGDVRFAYEMPSTSAGWIEVFDVETGGTRVVSRRELARMAARIEEWQKHIADLARDSGLDLIRVGLDRWEMETTLVEFVKERRLRKF